ncbi:MAG: branched-chain amino acid ABC transporter substrate-binding protein [Thermodesulfobacteriota bacterium]
MAIVALVLIGAGPGLAGSAKDGIKIGATGPFTGAAAAPGMEIYNSILLAVAERNAKGGLGGVQVEVVMGDTAGDAAQGVNVAEKFCADDKIYGVIGPAMSDIVAATVRIYSGCDLAMISSAASKPDLTEKGYNNFFRVCARNDAHGPAVAKYIAKELKAASVYILNAKDDYSQSLADEVAKALEALGVKQIWRDTVVSGEKDYSPVLTKVKAQNPDLVLFATKPPPDMTVMVRQMRELGIKSIFFGTEGAKDKKEFIEASEGAAEGAYVYHFATDIGKIPEAQDYVKAFESQYGSLSGFGPSAYEAAGILLDALAKAAEDGTLDRKEVREYVAATKDRKGILGFPVTFDPKGDLLGGATYIFKVVGGDFELVSVATGP